jgi:hypothetical protein
MSLRVRLKKRGSAPKLPMISTKVFAQTLADRCPDPDRNDRRDGLQPARLVAAPAVYRECSASLDCVIRNISKSGEKLGDVAGMTVPDEFGVHILQMNATSPRYLPSIQRRVGLVLKVAQRQRLDEVPVGSNSGSPNVASARTSWRL